MSARFFTCHSTALLAEFHPAIVLGQFDTGNSRDGLGRLKDFQTIQFFEALQDYGPKKWKIAHRTQSGQKI